jgi:hypothetical protein
MENYTLEALREIVGRLYWPEYAIGMSRENCIETILDWEENGYLTDSEHNG